MMAFIYKTRLLLLLAFSFTAAGFTQAEESPPGVSGQLGISLAADGLHKNAAIEFQRAALEEDTGSMEPTGASYRWAAAYEYFQAGEWAPTADLLDQCEDEDPGLEAPALLLRGQVAGARKQWDQASFYFSSAAQSEEGDDLFREYAARQAAAAEMQVGAAQEALLILEAAPGEQLTGLNAIEQYQQGRDKNPTLGGVMGMIPGLGYLYSGEYANAFRSLLLNGLFIFGMVHTADEEQWGAFAIISFFEITWYSGSIYGGIDAAHRYNARRLDTCIDGILGGTYYEPDYSAMPTLRLQFKF